MCRSAVRRVLGRRAVGWPASLCPHNRGRKSPARLPDRQLPTPPRSRSRRLTILLAPAPILTDSQSALLWWAIGPPSGRGCHRRLSKRASPVTTRQEKHGRGAPRPLRECCVMPSSRRLTRRSAVRLAAAAGALPLVHIRTAGAAGKLNVGFWDHWV